MTSPASPAYALAHIAAQVGLGMAQGPSTICTPGWTLYAPVRITVEK
ncbi:hypothetical protein [Luteipulveratus mongoliensis]|nr:hypothetical protein [Luteipulveratus mongoliensis]